MAVVLARKGTATPHRMKAPGSLGHMNIYELALRGLVAKFVPFEFALKGVSGRVVLQDLLWQAAGCASRACV